MLQKLNERIQGFVAWVVIILIALTFALFGIDYYMQSRQSSRAQAEVNGNPISTEEFELSFRRARQAQESAPMTIAHEKALKAQVLDGLIMNRISTQAAIESGFSVSKEQANAAILSIPQFQEEGHFSSARYQQALSNHLFTPETFQKEVQQGMLLNQQRFAFIGTSFVLPNEVTRFVNLYLQTRDYRYLVVPGKTFIKSVAVTDKEAQDYYQTHQNDYKSPEQVSVSYIALSAKDIRKNIHISDADIKQYYQDSQSNFLKPAQWQVAHILLRVPAGASAEEQNKIQQQANDAYQALKDKPELFEQKVSSLSDDKISVASQGLLPPIIAGQSEPSVDKALIGLTKPGQISEPVKTRHGFEIFKLVSYQPAVTKPLSDVKSIIKEQLLAEKTQAAFSSALEKLTDLTYQTPDALAPAAKELNLVVKQTGLFSRQGGESELTKNKQVIQAAFSHDVLELENNSDPIQVNNDSMIVLRVKQHINAQVKPFADVKNHIIKRLKEQKATAKAIKLGLVLEKATDEEIQPIIKQYQLNWKNAEGVKRNTSDVPEEINQLAFNIANQGMKMGAALDNGDFVLVALQAIHKGEMSQLDSEQINNITQQLEASYGIMSYDLYLNGLMKQADISK